MNKFLELPEEKQQTIINAALGVFGLAGYKKAFISEVAQAAGISKAMVFYYFGSKKALYLYLLEFSFESVMEVFSRETDKSVTDFFDRILFATRIKITFLKSHPMLMKFILSAYFETDAEVAREVGEFLKRGEGFREELVLTHLDREKFKSSVDPNLVFQMLNRYAKGCCDTETGESIDFDEVLKEFSNTIEMLKRNLYKEEYLYEHSD